MNQNILCLDLNTKIQYSLFNFFVPIATVAVVLNSLELYYFVSSLIAIVSIFVGLFSLFINLSKYNKFVYVDGDTMFLCSGSKHYPRVKAKFKVSEITPDSVVKGFTIKQNGKKYELLNPLMSIFGCICIAGPLLFIPIFKKTNVVSNKLWELSDLLPQLEPPKYKRPSNAENLIANILMWGIVLFLSLVGVLGLFLIPFYPFLGNV